MDSMVLLEVINDALPIGMQTVCCRYRLEREGVMGNREEQKHVK